MTDQNYHIVKSALSKDMCELIADYVLFKANVKPNIRQGDALKGVHREYGDLLMETLLLKLLPLVEKTVNKELWPTLSFCYLYKNGDSLAPHIDRSSCELVAGLCIGADEEFKKKHQSWPLILKVQGKNEPVKLDVGDLLIFPGHEIEHSRSPFEGNWFVSAIFGFVDKKGDYSYQKYDQRKRLGMPHVGTFRWMLGSLMNKIKKLF